MICNIRHNQDEIVILILGEVIHKFISQLFDRVIDIPSSN